MIVNKEIMLKYITKITSIVLILFYCSYSILYAQSISGATVLETTKELHSVLNFADSHVQANGKSEIFVLPKQYNLGKEKIRFLKNKSGKLSFIENDNPQSAEYFFIHNTSDLNKVLAAKTLQELFISILSVGNEDEYWKLLPNDFDKSYFSGSTAEPLLFNIKVAFENQGKLCFLNIQSILKAGTQNVDMREIVSTSLNFNAIDMLSPAGLTPTN